MTSNIIPIKKQPPAPSNRSVFRRASLASYALPVGAYAPNYRLSTPARENRSLAVAEANDFFSMCSPTLWGGEVSDQQEFGELLRAVVIQFLPTNRFHLELLAQIVDDTWKLRRMRRLQKNLFVNGPKDPDDSGIPRRVSNTFKADESIQAAIKRLDQSVTVYYRLTRASRQEGRNDLATLIED